MEIKKNKDNLCEYFTDGPSLFFIKFLYEHKSIIYDMILEQPKTYNLKKFIRELKKLVQYNFTEKEYQEELPKEYISNVLYEILSFEYKDINKIDIFQIIEKNMDKEYLLQHFELWWYQSIYMIGGSGYIRDINDYLKKYWNTEVLLSEEEINNRMKKSYNRYNTPRLFTEEEFDIFINGYDPYYPPNILDTKKINNDFLKYNDDSRMY